MKIIERKSDQITFRAKVDDSLANTIRRYMNKILIPAVEYLEISKNDSPLYDETISHRVGLIPLKIDSKKGDKVSENLTLEAKGPGMVLSQELKGNISPVYDQIPIVMLNKGQTLKLKAHINSGKGEEHSKYSPGLMYYRHVAEIGCDKKFLEQIKKTFPNNEIKEKDNKIMIIDDQKKEISDFCEGLSKENEKQIKVDLKDELVITVESFGQLSPKNMIFKSIQYLKKDLEGFSKKIR